MPAKHDLKKRHHGRRKKGSRKRKKLWLQRHKLRYRHPGSRRRTRKQIYIKYKRSLVRRYG